MPCCARWRRIGQVALSLYVAHVVLLVPVIPAFPEGGWLPFGLLLVVSVGGAWAWARFVGRGPVEWVIDRLSPPRHAPSDSGSVSTLTA